MESPQCLEDLPSAATVTQELCLPTRGTIVRHISSVAKRSGIRNVFVASDSDPDVPHLQQELGTDVSMVTTSASLVPSPSRVRRLQYERSEVNYFILQATNVRRPGKEATQM